jgi:hypothetical protein
MLKPGLVSHRWLLPYPHGRVDPRKRRCAIFIIALEWPERDLPTWLQSRSNLPRLCVDNYSTQSYV